MTYAIMDKDGLHVTSNQIAKELERKNLSASLITGIEDCPARWLSGVIIPKFMEVDMTAAVRGSAFHWVLEELFKLPPEERTKQQMKTIIKECFVNKEFEQFFIDEPEQKKWLVNAIKSYYDMGAQPEKVQIASVDIKGEERLGIEIKVKGKLGETDRELVGFVDRLRENPRKKGSVLVEDWKTGARVRRWKPNRKSNEGWAEQRQQLIYTMLLEKEDIDVGGAALIYPVAQEVVRVNTSSEKLRKKVVKDIENADRDLTAMISENTFEYQPSFLCAWCPLVKICPAANVRKAGKLAEAYEKQPEPIELEEGIELA